MRISDWSSDVCSSDLVTESSFPGKWKVIYFYPKDFTFVCPTEIVGSNNLAQDFEDRDAVLMGGSVDNEFVKLAWRREHPDLNKLGHYQFGDRSEEHTSELQSLMRISYAVFCLTKNKKRQ